MNTLLIVAGDPSGDLHGSHLIRALKKTAPSLRIAAVGGALMRQTADEFLEDLASRGVTGFWEPLGQLGFLLRLGRRLKDFLINSRPAAVICIDYYGFNRRVLGLAKAADIPAYYYISPQVWASRPRRVAVLKRLVRRLFVIFPFEEEIYRKAGVPCQFIGHPLLDLLPAAKEAGGLKPPVRVGLLPGSRPSEIRRHLPVFISAYRGFCRLFPECRAQLFAAQALPDSFYQDYDLAGIEIVRESDYRRRAALDIAFSSSGTATLENALLGIPMVVVYKLSWPTYWVARALIRVPHISMVNILAGRALVPELVQGRATAENISRAAVGLLENPRQFAALKKELLALREILKCGAPHENRSSAPEIAARRMLGDLNLSAAPGAA